MASKYKDCDGRIRCPCVRCINNRFEKLETVRAHVFDRGFMKGYEKWTYHGEPENVVDDEVVGLDDENDEMIPILQDFFPPTTENVQEGPTTNQHVDRESLKPICELSISEKNLNRSTKYKNGPSKEHMVDTWRVSHTKNLSSGFVEETATENFGELRKELDKKRLERQSQSDTSGKVLGKRPNYQRCMGYRTKGKGKKLHSQSQSVAQLLPPNKICNIVADMFTTLRDTFGSRLTPEQRAKLYNPRFDKFIQMYGQSQTPGGSSSQSYAAPSHQQHQPSLQQQQQQFGLQQGN